jgi:hypothetical protein
MRSIALARLLVAIGLAALGVGTVALGATPAQYFRARLNAECKSYTPRFHTLEDEMASEQRGSRTRAYFVDLGRFFSLLLSEDTDIERADVPSTLALKAARIRTLLRGADEDLRSGLVASSEENAHRASVILARIGSLGPLVNEALDRAGLRACGSDQS